MVRADAASLLSQAPATVLPGGTRGLCASVSGVPSAAGPDPGMRRDPGSAEGAGWDAR